MFYYSIFFHFFFFFSFAFQSEERKQLPPLRFRMLALNSSGRAFVAAKSPSSFKAAAPIQQRRRRSSSSSSAIVSASAEPQDFNYASPKPYSSPQAGEDLTPYFGKVHSHDAKLANTIHAWCVFFRFGIVVVEGVEEIIENSVFHHSFSRA